MIKIMIFPINMQFHTRSGWHAESSTQQCVLSGAIPAVCEHAVNSCMLYFMQLVIHVRTHGASMLS